ncbi:hypothetical protein SAY87_029251 [Trapa incisa]|uniref:Uncharacterized protein n=1 Tax=Trapa incisa TaxID=236973 RepID=A0AAN7L4D3_9MYRT|nr:hypothetical protein SAY87_029251 [Trapa incisa]
MTAVVGEWMMAAKEEQAVAAMSLACTVISPHDDGGEAEASDSNSSTLPHNPGKRRTKHHHDEGPLNGKNRTFCMIDVFRNVNRPDQQHLVDWGSGGIASRFHGGGDQRGAGEEAAEHDECDKDTDTNSKLGVKIFGVQFN